MKTNKRILIIANKIVFPALDGGAVAIKSLCEVFLQLNYHIDLICINKKSDNVTKNSETVTPKNLSQFIYAKNMDFDLIKFLSSVFKKKSYQASRFYSKSIKNIIQSKIDTNNQDRPYDVVIFESIFTLSYLKKLKFKPLSKIILRAHNVEHKIWEDLSQTNRKRKIAYLFLAHQIENTEKSIPKEIDHIFTLSEIDTKWYRKKYPEKTHNIPVTFKTENWKGRKIQNSLVHLGAMDWKPNLEGIDWFLTNVLPKFKNSNHQTNQEYFKIFIAGKGMPKKYYKYNKYFSNTESKSTDYSIISVEDKVNHAQEYLQNKELMFVPLFSGSGIRIKILEGMALGIPIVSTTKGAQGIPYTHKKNIFIADTPNEFYRAICLLIKDKKLAKKIGNNGRNLIKTHFSKQVVINKINKILN